MDPETDVSSVTDVFSDRVRKRAYDDDDCSSDDTVESSPPPPPLLEAPAINCNNLCKEPYFCTEPHPCVGGISLRDVVSITIRPSTEFNKPTVKIYGAIGVYNSAYARIDDYLFKREKKDALEFDLSSTGQSLTLPLQDPLGLRFFDDDVAEFILMFILMFDDDTIFDEQHKHYRLIVTKSSDLFPDVDMEKVGCGIYYLPRYFPTYPDDGGCVELTKLPRPDEIEGKIRLEKVASVDVKIALMESGKLAKLVFKPFRSGFFYGKITARLCLVGEGDSMVLFEKKETEAVFVNSDAVFPLSRSLVAVGCGSSLVIDVQLQDAFEHVHRTIHFRAGDSNPDTTILRGSHSDLMHVKIVWTQAIRRPKAREQLEFQAGLGPEPDMDLKQLMFK